MFGVTANPVSVSSCTLIVLLRFLDVGAAVTEDIPFNLRPESSKRGSGDGSINGVGEEKRDEKEGDEVEGRDVVGTLRLEM